MDTAYRQKLHMKIDGMYCTNCAGRIEKTLAQAEGVLSAAADYGQGCADVVFEASRISCRKIVSLVETLDYEVLSETVESLPEAAAGTFRPATRKPEEETSKKKRGNEGKRRLLLVVLILVLSAALQFSGVLKLLVPGQLADSSMGYGMLFVIGLVTSVHCIAMCGGINLSQSLAGNLAWNQNVVSAKEDRDQSGNRKTDGPKRNSESNRTWRQVLLPALVYNLGRVCSYTLIGLILASVGFFMGGAGQVGISSLLQGIIKMAAGVFMILMGCSMLDLIPGIRKLIWKLQTRMAGNVFYRTRKNRERKQDADTLPAEKTFRTAKEKEPFIVGLLNGIMPCGPLQAMWLVAFASANPLEGALSMLAFSLGTVPLMLGFGSIVAALGKKFKQVILTAGAVLVVVLGMAMFFQGGALSGWVLPDSVLSLHRKNVARIEDGVQVVPSVLETGSYPDITVQAGMPVRWEIEATEDAINGCNYKILIPEYELEYSFEPGLNIIEFTPERTGEVGYHCWMGMIYGKITVTE